MATTTITRLDEISIRNRTLGAMLSGLVAGIVFGLLLQDGGSMTTIASLVGMSSVAAGWVVHILISVVFALGFAAVVSVERLTRFADRWSGGVVTGATYGVVLWVVAAGVLMPLWLAAVGAVAPAIPNLSLESLAGHVLYGAVLGGLYPALTRTISATRRNTPGNQLSP
jgi:uncharacterized membrane protein YagU involved in acid resistance